MNVKFVYEEPKAKRLALAAIYPNSADSCLDGDTTKGDDDCVEGSTSEDDPFA